MASAASADSSLLVCTQCLQWKQRDVQASLVHPKQLLACLDFQPVPEVVLLLQLMLIGSPVPAVAGQQLMAPGVHAALLHD